MASRNVGISYYIGAAANTYGQILSMSYRKGSGSVETVEDDNGDTSEYTVVNLIDEYEMQIVPKSGTAMPAVGDTLNAYDAIASNSANILVTSVAVNETNTAYPTATITGQRWITNGVPA